MQRIASAIPNLLTEGSPLTGPESFSAVKDIVRYVSAVCSISRLNACAITERFQSVKYPGFLLRLDCAERLAQRNQHDEALRILRCIDRSSLTPPQLLSFILQYANLVSRESGHALEELRGLLPSIAEVYTHHSSARNLASQFAWQACIPEREDYEATLPFFDFDDRANRLSDAWRFKRTTALASIGRFDAAVTSVDTLYLTNPKLMNGYAEIAYHCFGHYRCCHDRSLEWYEKDIQLGRLTSSWTTKYVTALSACGSLQKARSFIEDRYREDSKDSSLYTTLGMISLLYGHLTVPDALRCFELDVARDRMNLDGRVRWACLMAASGNCTAALKEVRQLKEENGIDSSALFMVSWWALRFAPGTLPTEKALVYFEEENQARRLTPWWRTWRAALKAHLGDLDHALAETNGICESNSLIPNVRSIIALAAPDFEMTPSSYFHLFEQDYRAGRMNAATKLLWAYFSHTSSPELSSQLLAEANDETSIAAAATPVYAPFLNNIRERVTRFAHAQSKHRPPAPSQQVSCHGWLRRY